MGRSLPYAQQPRPMGTGTAAGQAAGAILTKIAPFTGPAAPFVIAAGLIVSIVSDFFGGGCGQTCVVAAQTQQVYDAVGDNIEAVAKAGMISGADAVSILQSLVTAAQGAETANQQGAAGSAEVASAVQTHINNVSGLGASTQPLNLSAAQQLYVGNNPSEPGGVGAKGWYPGSVASATQLTNQILSAVPASSLTGGGSITASLTAPLVTVGGLGISPLVLLIGAGLLWWGLS